MLHEYASNRAIVLCGIRFLHWWEIVFYTQPVAWRAITGTGILCANMFPIPGLRL